MPSYKKEWEKKYPWVFCSDSSKEMFVKFVRSGGNLLLDQGEHGLPGALQTGNMLLSYSSHTLGPSVTKMQQLPLIWLSKQREGIPFWSYTVQLLLESGQKKRSKIVRYCCSC